MSIILPGQNTQLDFYESKYTPEQVEASIGKGVIIQNQTFWTWDVASGQYVDTGVIAGTPSNRNLLDNAYFIGGGSQQGGGQFPINQRGLTEYTGAGYTIDRWFMSNSSCKLNIEETGLRITRLNNGSAFFMQKIPFAMLQDGIYTFSAIVDDELQSMTLQVNQTMSRVLSSFAGGWALGFEVGGENYVPHIRSLGTNSAESVFVAAAKLELGPNQTLAHQDAGGNWILNDPPPKFGAELAECQRYLNVVRANNVWSMFGFAYAISSTMGAAFVPLGVPLRASPTVTVDGDVQMSGNAGSVTIDSVTNDNWSSNGVRLRLNVPDGGLTPDALYQFRAQGNNAKIIFDANL